MNYTYTFKTHLSKDLAVAKNTYSSSTCKILSRDSYKFKAFYIK